MSTHYKLKEGFDPRWVKNVITADKERPSKAYIEPGNTFECADDLSKKRAYEVVVKAKPRATKPRAAKV